MSIGIIDGLSRQLYCHLLFGWVEIRTLRVFDTRADRICVSMGLAGPAEAGKRVPGTESGDRGMAPRHNAVLTGTVAYA